MELKPCPFCGAPGVVEQIEADCFGVGCADCDFQLMNGPVGIGWFASKSAAASVWNRRTPSTAAMEAAE